jgi:proteic killer suppression protein
MNTRTIHTNGVKVPGFDLHELKGNRAGEWSISVTGNYRMIFKFEDGDAFDVDLEDYH